MSSKTKATIEEEEDAATVGGYHGYPVLMRTDMSEEMAYEVRYFESSHLALYIALYSVNALFRFEIIFYTFIFRLWKFA